MTPPRPARLLALLHIVSAVACANTTPVDPETPAAPALLLSAPPPMEPPSPAASAAPSPVVEPASTAAREPTDGHERCSLRGWRPGPLGASVVVIPAAAMREVMAPVVDATCRCTRDGEQVKLLVRFWPERGEVKAEAPGQPGIGGCLARLLAPGRFTAFELGSDCIDCGPHRIWPTTERPRPSSTVSYPVQVDRKEAQPL